jgi:hypothetical protein
MKFWIGGALVEMLAVCIAGCGGSSASGGSPTPTRLLIAATPTRTPVPVTTAPLASAAFSCGQKTCVPTQPTSTPPGGCGFGEWDQCGKQAAEPAITDFNTRYVDLPNSLAVSSDYVEWQDSCLGVQQLGVVCAQVITPGYRVILQAAGTPFVEYHTDLNGHAVFVAEYATYQDVPTVQPTNH